MGEAELAAAKRQLLEKYLRGEVAQNLAGPAPGPIGRRRGAETPGHAPLSLVQEALWRHAQATHDASGIFNESITIHRKGVLDPQILEGCMVEIIRRHEAWRTTFDSVNGQPFQVVHPAPTHFTIPVVDLRALPESAREAEAARAARQDARPPFDLKRGPLVRARLIKLGDQQFRLYMTMHQIVVDGVSVYQVFPTELAALYEAFSNGQASPLPELPIQSADYATWDRDRTRIQRLDSQAAFWREQLGRTNGALKSHQKPSLGATHKYRGAIEPFEFSRELSASLRKLAYESGATLFMVLVAGFAALLHAYTAQEGIFIGTLAPAGRKRAEVQGLLGYFLNPVALRTQPSGQLTFLEMIAQAREVVSEALCHDEVPLETALRDTSVLPGINYESLVDHLFENLISLAPSVAALPDGWEQTPMDAESGASRWNLYLELSDRPTGILGRAQYNADLFDRTSVQNLIRDFQSLLVSAARKPNARMADLLPSFSCTHFSKQSPQTVAAALRKANRESSTCWRLNGKPQSQFAKLHSMTTPKSRNWNRATTWKPSLSKSGSTFGRTIRSTAGSAIVSSVIARSMTTGLSAG